MIMQTKSSLNLCSSSLPPSLPFLRRRKPSKSVALPQKAAAFRCAHVAFSSPSDRPGRVGDSELELLGRPTPPIPLSDDVEEPGKEEGEGKEEGDGKETTIDVSKALEPFIKLFRAKEAAGLDEGSGKVADLERRKQVVVKYYEPRKGDFVVGVVVSGNERKLDVNVGADMLGTMLAKDALPLHDGELQHRLFDLPKDAPLMKSGKVGILKEDESLFGEKVPGRPLIEAGTVVFAQVLGRTLSGRPLISMRKLFVRLAWHRVRQIQNLNEPIEIKIIEWNTGGLLSRIEGLRAFLPKAELMNIVKNFTELKAKVGSCIHVLIKCADEANNSLIISEREAWDWLNLQEGTLLEGTVKNIFKYGAQVMIGETNRSGLLHISSITRTAVGSVEDVLKVGEKLKVLVVKSLVPNKITVSTALLESKPGLFLKDKEKVFSEAEEMAKQYRSKLPIVNRRGPPPEAPLPFDNEAELYANWKWFKFEQRREQAEVDGENTTDQL